MSISEDMMVRIELLIGAFGRSETLWLPEIKACALHG